MRNDLFTPGAGDTDGQATPKDKATPLPASQRETILLRAKSTTRLDVQPPSAVRYWPVITVDPARWQVPPLSRQGLASLAVFLVGLAAVMAQPLFFALAISWALD